MEEVGVSFPPCMTVTGGRETTRVVRYLQHKPHRVIGTRLEKKEEGILISAELIIREKLLRVHCHQIGVVIGATIFCPRLIVLK